jgi:hypothetical protein
MLARPKATHAVHAHGLTRTPAALAHWIVHEPKRATISDQAWDLSWCLLAPPTGLRRLVLSQPHDHVRITLTLAAHGAEFVGLTVIEEDAREQVARLEC